MNPSAPTFIIMKRKIAGPSILDHGQSFGSARKEMLHAENLDAGAPHACPGPDSDTEAASQSESAGPDRYEDKIRELKRLAGQLQAGIAALEAENGEMGADEGESDEDEGESAHSHGKKLTY